MGMQRIARRQRKMQREAVLTWKRNLPHAVREQLIVRMSRENKLLAVKRMAIWCGLACVMIAATALAFGGCGDDTGTTNDCLSMVSDAGPRTDNQDARTARGDMGSDLDMGRGTTAMDGGHNDANKDAVGDGGQGRDGKPSTVTPGPGADGLCWYRGECPPTHFVCTMPDESTVPDAFCMSLQTVRACCDVPLTFHYEVTP